MQLGRTRGSNLATAQSALVDELERRETTTMREVRWSTKWAELFGVGDLMEPTTQLSLGFFYIFVSVIFWENISSKNLFDCWSFSVINFSL